MGNLYSAVLADNFIEVHKGNHHCSLSNFWVMDNSHDDKSVDAETGQKKYTPIDLPSDISAEKVIFNVDYMEVDWNHSDRKSLVSMDLVSKMLSEDSSISTFSKDIETWTGSDFNSDRLAIAQIDYSDYLEPDGIGFNQWLEGLHSKGFALIHNVEPTIDSTRSLADRIAFASKTFFGELGVVQSSSDDNNLENTNDSAWSNDAIDSHTDGSYMHNSPGLQALHCVQMQCDGGDSTLVDGYKLAEIVKSERPDFFEILSSVKIPYHYISDGYFFQEERSVFELDSSGNLQQVTYNAYDRSPMNIKFPLSHDVYNALRYFHRLAQDEENLFSFKLPEGTAVIFDNWRVLHGRKSFHGDRKLHSFYINRDDYMSSLRVVKSLGVK